MKKKGRPSAGRKPGRAGSKRRYPDGDPEWEHLEERYSQINGELRKLVELLPPTG